MVESAAIPWELVTLKIVTEWKSMLRALTLLSLGMQKCF